MRSSLSNAERNNLFGLIDIFYLFFNIKRNYINDKKKIRIHYFGSIDIFLFNF